MIVPFRLGFGDFAFPGIMIFLLMFPRPFAWGSMNISINLDLQHLRLIKHIVDEGSMSGATQKMFLTQSALSHLLKEIESDLGVKLFLRKSKKLLLTEAGSAILYHSERILAEYGELEKKITDIKT